MFEGLLSVCHKCLYLFFLEQIVNIQVFEYLLHPLQKMILLHIVEQKKTIGQIADVINAQNKGWVIQPLCAFVHVLHG